MNCSTCKQQIEPGSIFCVYCGTRVPQATPTPVSSSLPQIEYPNKPVDEPQVESQGSILDQPINTVAIPQNPVNPNPTPQISLPNTMPAQQVNYYKPAEPPTSTAAILSLLFGILSWFGILFIAPLAGVIAGHIARKNIRQSGGSLRGDGLALAGLIISYANLVLTIMICGVILLFIVASAEL